MPVRSREIHALSTRIQLPVMRKLLSIMDGQHSALRQGRGWEFMDLAPYQPGDDVREIDWAATARTGSPIIKRHEATANLQVMLVVDTGREMGALAPSGQTKEEVALAACEAIAWLSAARGDQIGLVAGDDKRVRFMPARSGNAHAETLLRRIEEDITLRSPHANVAKLLARARTITRRRSLIVIVTDSTQPTASPESSDLIKSMSARHQVILISVEDIDPTTLSEVTSWRGRQPTSWRCGVPRSRGCSMRGVSSTWTCRPVRIFLVRLCVLLKGEFMSGEVTDDLFNPIIYPHWMWVLGVTLVVAVVGWVCFCLWRWWTSRIGEVMELQTISDARRKKYLSYVDQIADRYADGDLDARGVHLALAGLMRALGTERTGRDLEVATVSEVRELVPVWPGLADVLAACEASSFTSQDIPAGRSSHEAVTRVLTMAVEAVNV